MEWFFIAGLALGIPFMTPPFMQALGRFGNDSAPRTGDLSAFAGFGLTAFGLAGMLALGFSAEPLLAVAGSAAIGIACGALNPDLLGWLSRRGSPAASDDDDAETPAPKTIGSNCNDDA